MPIAEMLDFTVYRTMVLMSTRVVRSEINRLILPSVEAHAITNLRYTEWPFQGACCRSSSGYGECNHVEHLNPHCLMKPRNGNQPAKHHEPSDRPSQRHVYVQVCS